MPGKSKRRAGDDPDADYTDAGNQSSDHLAKKPRSTAQAKKVETPKGKSAAQLPTPSKTKTPASVQKKQQQSGGDDVVVVEDGGKDDEGEPRVQALAKVQTKTRYMAHPTGFSFPRYENGAIYIALIGGDINHFKLHCNMLEDSSTWFAEMNKQSVIEADPRKAAKVTAKTKVKFRYELQYNGEKGMWLLERVPLTMENPPPAPVNEHHVVLVPNRTNMALVPSRLGDNSIVDASTSSNGGRIVVATSVAPGKDGQASKAPEAAESKTGPASDELSVPEGQAASTKKGPASSETVPASAVDAMDGVVTEGSAKEEANAEAAQDAVIAQAAEGEAMSALHEIRQMTPPANTDQTAPLLTGDTLHGQEPSVLLASSQPHVEPSAQTSALTQAVHQGLATMQNRDSGANDQVDASPPIAQPSVQADKVDKASEVTALKMPQVAGPTQGEPLVTKHDDATVPVPMEGVERVIAETQPDGADEPSMQLLADLVDARKVQAVSNNVPPANVVLAYANLLHIYYKKAPRFSKNIERALGQCELLVEVAEYHSSLEVVRPHIRDALLAHGRLVYAEVLCSPIRSLKLATKIESTPIFTEAVIHLAPRCSYEFLATDAFDGVSNDLKNLLYSKWHSIELNRLRINQLLSLNGLLVHGKDVSLHTISGYDTGDFETWVIIQMWRDWFIGNLRLVGHQLSVGTLYRMLAKGGDAYLPLEVVQLAVQKFPLFRNYEAGAIWMQTPSASPGPPEAESALTVRAPQAEALSPKLANGTAMEGVVPGASTSTAAEEAPDVQMAETAGNHVDDANTDQAAPETAAALAIPTDGSTTSASNPSHDMTSSPQATKAASTQATTLDSAVSNGIDPMAETSANDSKTGSSSATANVPYDPAKIEKFQWKDAAMDLRMLKEYAQNMVQAIATNNSMLDPDVFGFGHLTCTEVADCELPWAHSQNASLANSEGASDQMAIDLTD